MEQNPYAAPSVDPTAASQIPSHENGPRDWTVSEVISKGWETTKANAAELIGGFTLILVINQGVQSVLQNALGLAPKATLDPMEAISGMMVVMPISILLGVYFQIGQFRVALQAARGEKIEFGTFFSGYDRLLPGILAMIVMYAAIALGLLALIIGAVIVSLALSMTMFLVADTKSGVMEMLTESWNATKGQKMQIFGFYLACTGVMLLGLLALCLGFLVAYPVVMVAMAEVYMCVTGRRSAEA